MQYCRFPANAHGYERRTCKDDRAAGRWVGELSGQITVEICVLTGSPSIAFVQQLREPGILLLKLK